MMISTGITLPIAPSERIVSLDVLRGIAVFGILIMNIQSFSMIGSAYTNPTAYGDLTGANKLVWILSHVFADQKFMTIFSILFGAGVAMMAERMVARGGTVAGLHYRRTFWLLVIGALHAYLLWYGDILFMYGLCSLFVFLFRKKLPKTLLIVGICFVAVASLYSALTAWSIQFWPEAAKFGLIEVWKPGVESLTTELNAYRGSFSDQMAQRVPTALFMHTFLFITLFAWRAGGLMLVGMALYKWGVLSAKRSNQFYVRSMMAGFFIGFPIIIVGVVLNFSADWSFEYSMFLGNQFNYWGSLFVAFGYISAIMLICQKWAKNGFLDIFAGVGRTALSNYLVQTIICTSIFYGYGLGLYGHVERIHQILIVIGVWLWLVVLTNWWLQYFRFGPFEWAWRSLAYWKVQPLRNPEPELTTH